MEILIYTGSDLQPGQAEAVLREAAGAADLQVTVCGTAEQMRDRVRQAVKEGPMMPERSILFHGVEGIYPLKPSQVRFFRGQGHRVQAALTDGRILESRTMRVSVQSVLLPLLEGNAFVQAGRAFFINADFVSSVTPGKVYMKDGTTVGISRNYYRAWLARMEAGGVRM